MSQEMIRELCAGYSKFNSRVYKNTKNAGGEVETPDDLPEMPEEDQAYIKQHMKAYYGLT